MNVVLIYNNKSGGAYNLTTLRPLLRQYGVEISYSFTVHQLGSKKLSRLIKEGATIMAVGGDGTLNAVARLVVGTPSTLFPIPGGTFNHFVRDLGMPVNVEDVLSLIEHAKPLMIDVAYVNDELFLNNSNLGLYPFSLIERKTTKKYIGKWGAAILSAVDQLSLFRRHRLTIDGNRVRSPFVFVGNNIYDIETSLIPQRTQLTNGVLTTMIATSQSRLSLMRDIFAVVRGDVTHRDDFHLSTRPDMTIYARREELPVSFDGEVKRLRTPLKYRIEPGALRVLVVKKS